MTTMGTIYDQERARALGEDGDSLWPKFAKLRAALREIRDCHLGDCPAGQDELSHARAHVFTLREMAMRALKD